MPSLRNLAIPVVLDTSSHDLTTQFFLPLLSNSTRYDRGVGYFSSGWLRINCAGMVAFANNGGRARWVASPILDQADWEALITGDAAREDAVLHAALQRSITNLSETLERDTLSALAWMIADEVLEFRLALPCRKLKDGDFHDKFGVFTDSEGDSISFNGSYNDSVKGTRNYESIKVFRSWQPGFDELVQSDVDRFNRLWGNLDPNVRIFDLPAAAREQILQLRAGDRPYVEPDWVRLRRQREARDAAAHPALPPGIELRDYQTEAIEAWFAHGCRGLLEMATGTGKTITALAASARLWERQRRLAVVIAVPYQHLVDQWHQEVVAFGYQPILAYQSRSRWSAELSLQVTEFNAGYRDFISVIVTHTTFSSPAFQQSVARLDAPSLLIADEAHHLGAERSRQSYPVGMPFRLALSATPDRWFDEPGSEALRTYFGETVFSFPLEKAIGLSLTPYYYYPHLVPLTEAELEEYEDLSARIGPLMGRTDERGQQTLTMLLIRRAELLNKAENKIATLSSLVDKQGQVDHALFYCAPGQIDVALQLLGWEKGLLMHRFTAEEDPKERQQLLADFASGRLQALVAMKCLDEGVDVPSTHTAYLLASSGNPREFIQRRGRILRKAPGKEFSVIHDLVAVPPTAWTASEDSPTYRAERSIMRRELGRFKEFANPAINKHEALDAVWDIAKRYRLMDF